MRDQVFPLTLMEANVLRYLIQHEGKPVSRKTMLEEVWGLHEDTDTRAIDNFIVRLRRYIEDDPTHPRHLLTVAAWVTGSSLCPKTSWPKRPQCFLLAPAELSDNV